MTYFEIITWLVFAAAQLADVITTRRVLDQGGRELNPAIAFLMGRLGGKWWIAKILMAWGAAGALQWAGYGWAVAVFAVVTGAVAANNWRQIK